MIIIGGFLILLILILLLEACNRRRSRHERVASGVLCAGLIAQMIVAGAILMA